MPWGWLGSTAAGGVTRAGRCGADRSVCAGRAALLTGTAAPRRLHELRGHTSRFPARKLRFALLSAWKTLQPWGRPGLAGAPAFQRKATGVFLLVKGRIYFSEEALLPHCS